MRVDSADGLTEAKADGTTGTLDLGGWGNQIGEWWSGATGYIGFFQLPDLGMVSDPFVTSELGIRVFEMSGNPSWDADVSMVRVSDNTDINHATDYDAEAVLVQSSFLSTDVVTALGELGGGDRNLFTSAAANATLTSELNKAYNGGAGIGRYLVMRIAKSGTLPPSDSYKILSRNAGADGEHPLINFSLSGSELPGDSIRTALESVQSTSTTGGTVAGRPAGITVSESTVFYDKDNANWVKVINLALVADGVSSQGAQTLSMNVTELPEGGANYRVYKTTASGGDFLGNAKALALGANDITIAGVAFDRAVKIQLSSADVRFDSLVVNGTTIYPEPVE